MSVCEHSGEARTADRFMRKSVEKPTELACQVGMPGNQEAASCTFAFPTR